MKTYFILGMLLFGYVQTFFAQEEQPDKKYVAGGQINFISQNNYYPDFAFKFISNPNGSYADEFDKTKIVTLRATPYIGKQLNKNLILGIQLGFGYLSSRLELLSIDNFPNVDTLKYRSVQRQYHFNVFGRYTLNPQHTIALFLQPYLGYSLGKNSIYDMEEISSTSQINFIETGIDVGLQYNVNSRFRILLNTGGLYYLNGSWKQENYVKGYSFNTFGTNFNLSNMGLGCEIRI